MTGPCECPDAIKALKEPWTSHNLSVAKRDGGPIGALPNLHGAFQRTGEAIMHRDDAFETSF